MVQCFEEQGEKGNYFQRICSNIKSIMVRQFKMPCKKLQTHKMNIMDFVGLSGKANNMGNSTHKYRKYLFGYR